MKFIAAVLATFGLASAVRTPTHDSGNRAVALHHDFFDWFGGSDSNTSPNNYSAYANKNPWSNTPTTPITNPWANTNSNTNSISNPWATNTNTYKNTNANGLNWNQQSNGSSPWGDNIIAGPSGYTTNFARGKPIVPCSGSGIKIKRNGVDVPYVFEGNPFKIACTNSAGGYLYRDYCTNKEACNQLICQYKVCQVSDGGKVFRQEY